MSRGKLIPICCRILKIIFLLICILTPVSACQTANRNQEDPIEMLQKEAPFTIVVPTYFPPGIIHKPIIVTGPEKGKSENSVWISLYYRDKGESNNSIHIIEENAKLTIAPSQPSNTYFNYRGIEILEEEEVMIVPNSYTLHGNGSGITGLSYRWYWNGVSFTLYVLGYSKDEGRRVVQSLIK